MSNSRMQAHCHCLLFSLGFFEQQGSLLMALLERLQTVSVFGWIL